MRRLLKKSFPTKQASWLTAAGVTLGLVGAALVWQRARRLRQLRMTPPGPEIATAGQTDDHDYDFGDSDEEVPTASGTQNLGGRFQDEQESPARSAEAATLAAASKLTTGHDVLIDGMVFTADGDDPVEHLFDAPDPTTPRQ